MAELQFEPNEQARALASGRGRVIGLLLSNLTSPYAAELIRAFESVARRRGYSVLLTSAGAGGDEEADAARTLRRKRVDGIAMLPTGLEAGSVREMLDTGIPLVLAARYFHGLPVDVVRHDNRQTGYLATRHLLDLGHRRILYLARAQRISTVADRREGVLAALEDAGQPHATVQFVPTEPNAADGYRATAEVLAGGADPTGVIAYNDYTGLGAYRALLEAGRRVPDDVSLIACDDTGIADFLPTRFTTISESWADVGRLAAEVLIRRIEGYAGPATTTIIGVELRVRESTATPARAELPGSVPAH
jgi:LacI family transcriptional regulator